MRRAPPSGTGRPSSPVSGAEEPEHVEHVVEAGRTPGHPARRADRAARELLARRRAVRELDALALAEEEDRVVPDDVAAAERLHPDLARGALAHHPVPLVDDVLRR